MEVPAAGKVAFLSLTLFSTVYLRHRTLKACLQIAAPQPHHVRDAAPGHKLDYATLWSARPSAPAEKAIAQGDSRHLAAREGITPTRVPRVSRDGSTHARPNAISGNAPSMTAPVQQQQAERTSASAYPPTVRIELSMAQVTAIRRDADTRKDFAFLLTGSGERLRELANACRELGDTDKNISSSFILGLLVFAVFPEDGTLIANADIARTLGMNPSTAHRYVGTLVVAGLVEKDPDTRTYRLAR